MGKASRKEVYLALDSERAYQDKRWGSRDSAEVGAAAGETAAHFLIYMEQYIAKAKGHLTALPDPEAAKVVLDDIRKVTALGVAAMEALGAPQREGYEQHFAVAQEESKGPGLSSYHSKHGK